jgi:toluene monooxygenase system protein B
MAPFPVQAIFEGDFVVLLVPVDDEQPMTEVAQAVAHHVVGKRVPAQDRPMKVSYQGAELADDATITSSQIGPLDVLRVAYA